MHINNAALYRFVAFNIPLKKKKNILYHDFMSLTTCHNLEDSWGTKQIPNEIHSVNHFFNMLELLKFQAKVWRLALS